MIRDGNVPADRVRQFAIVRIARRPVVARHHREARRGGPGGVRGRRLPEHELLAFRLVRAGGVPPCAALRARRTRTDRRGPSRPARDRHAVPRDPHEGRRPRPVEPRRHRERGRPPGGRRGPICDGADCRAVSTTPASAQRPPPRSARCSPARARALRAGGPPPMSFFVPGRIEVLGKHTDYAGGRSLLCAAEQGFCLVAAAQERPAGHRGETRTPATGPTSPLAPDLRAGARALEQLPGHGPQARGAELPRRPDRRRPRVCQRPAAGLRDVQFERLHGGRVPGDGGAQRTRLARPPTSRPSARPPTWPGIWAPWRTAGPSGRLRAIRASARSAAARTTPPSSAAGRRR